MIKYTLYIVLSVLITTLVVNWTDAQGASLKQEDPYKYQICTRTADIAKQVQVIRQSTGEDYKSFEERITKMYEDVKSDQRKIWKNKVLEIGKKVYLKYDIRIPPIEVQNGFFLECGNRQTAPDRGAMF